MMAKQITKTRLSRLATELLNDGHQLHFDERRGIAASALTKSQERREQARLVVQGTLSVSSPQLDPGKVINEGEQTL